AITEALEGLNGVSCPQLFRLHRRPLSLWRSRFSVTRPDGKPRRRRRGLGHRGRTASQALRPRQLGRPPKALHRQGPTTIQPDVATAAGTCHRHTAEPDLMVAVVTFIGDRGKGQARHPAKGTDLLVEADKF